jgi:hypothetical protein
MRLPSIGNWPLLVLEHQAADLGLDPVEGGLAFRSGCKMSPRRRVIRFP